MMEREIDIQRLLTAGIVLMVRSLFTYTDVASDIIASIIFRIIRIAIIQISLLL